MVGTDCRQKYLRSGKYVIYVDIISGIYIAGLLAEVPMAVFPTDFNRIKVTGLLEDFELTGCLGEGAPLLSFSPDYEAVRQQLEEQRRISLDYLAEVVRR